MCAKMTNLHSGNDDCSICEAYGTVCSGNIASYCIDCQEQ